MNIAELMELEKKATPGTWEAWAGLNVRSTFGEAVCSGGMQRGEQKDSGDAENHANIALIAAMHNALPSIHARMQKLEAVAEAASAYVRHRNRCEVESMRKGQIKRKALHDALDALDALGGE